MKNMEFAEKYFFCLSCTGKKNNILPNKFLHIVNPDMYHPGMSPIYLLPGAELKSEDFRLVDEIISPELPDHILASPVPYFSILDLPDIYPDTDDLLRRCVLFHSKSSFDLIPKVEQGKIKPQSQTQQEVLPLLAVIFRIAQLKKFDIVKQIKNLYSDNKKK